MINPQNVINKILSRPRLNIDKISKKKERAIAGKKCWNCGKTFQPGEDWYYYYHGDQDDRVCEDCAKKLKHNDTAYQGMSVYKTG